MLDVLNTNVGGAISAMLAELRSIRQEIRALRADAPAPRPIQRTLIYVFGSATHTQLQIPVELHVTKIIVSQDVSGRGTLSFAGQQLPIRAGVNSPISIDFDTDHPYVIKGDVFTYTAPTVGTNWDIVIFGKPAPVQMQGAAQRT